MTKRIPEHGTGWADLKQQMAELRQHDFSHRDGRLPLHCYFAGDDVSQVASDAWTLFASTNALAPQAFPSCLQMEQDVVSMVLGLLNAAPGASGSMTSGGTESIILAVKAARDHARAQGRRGELNLVLPVSAHPAFDKAAHLLGLATIRVPVANDYRCDVAAMEAAVNPGTIMLVASAPCLPYGLIDPVEAMAAMALRQQVWLHVDACIGGMLAPFARELGYPVPAFDFAVPGVRSMSADLHKFGYTAKGASLVLYASSADHEHQFCRFTDWPKGDYFTPTLAGTRSGGAIAAAWAVLHYLGREGYLRVTQQLMQLRARYLAQFAAIPQLALLGTPDLSVLTITAPGGNIFAIADEMKERGWYMSLVARPRAIQQTVNLVHEAVIEQYFADLKASIAYVEHSGTTPRVADDRLVMTY